jgi:hypothetical protein
MSDITARNVVDNKSTTLTASTVRSWQELAVYNGQQHIGYVVERDGRQFEARDASHKFIGNFSSLRAAMRACASAP